MQKGTLLAVPLCLYHYILNVKPKMQVSKCDVRHFTQHAKEPINFICVVASAVQSIVTSFRAVFLCNLAAALVSSAVDNSMNRFQICC